MSESVSPSGSLSGSLSGPSADPAAGGPARQLVVLLHGIGADGADLLGLAPFVAEALPDAAFVAPDGPFPYDMAPFGRQWFSLQDRSLPAMAQGLRAAAPLVDAYLDAQLAALGLDETGLALVGFSQGTMMALHVALRRGAPVAAVVGYSGRLIAPELLERELVSRPPVLLVHGDADPVVPFVSMRISEEALNRAQVPVETLVRPGMAHGIDHPALLAGIDFVAKRFGK